jgi:hypothetical protein
MLGVVKVQWYRGRQWKAPVLYLGNRAGPVSLPREQTVCFRQLGCIKAFLFFCQEHEFQLQSMLEKECVGKVVGREKAASACWVLPRSLLCPALRNPCRISLSPFILRLGLKNTPIIRTLFSVTRACECSVFLTFF